MQIDRYLYGHPGRYRFCSVNEFVPHATWLLKGQRGECTCIGCTGGRVKRRPGRPPAVASSKAPRASTVAAAQGQVLRERYTAGSAEVREAELTRLLTELRDERSLDTAIKAPEDVVSVVLPRLLGAG